MATMTEASRLYQAALEDLRARRSEIGEGYQTTEERAEIARLEAELEAQHAHLFAAWAGRS